MEELICPKCGPIETDYYTELKSNQNVARCNKCDTFIKNISYEQPKLYVGRYKGKFISEIDDVDYLKWAKREMNTLSKKQFDAIQKQIDRLEHLAK